MPIKPRKSPAGVWQEKTYSAACCNCGCPEVKPYISTSGRSWRQVSISASLLGRRLGLPARGQLPSGHCFLRIFIAAVSTQSWSTAPGSSPSRSQRTKYSSAASFPASSAGTGSDFNCVRQSFIFMVGDLSRSPAQVIHGRAGQLNLLRHAESPTVELDSSTYNFLSSSSPITFTPTSRALSSFEPGFSPTTR